MPAPLLSLARMTPALVYDLTALTGGLGNDRGVIGADFYVTSNSLEENSGYTKFTGNKQIRSGYTVLPTTTGGTPVVPRTGASSTGSDMAVKLDNWDLLDGTQEPGEFTVNGCIAWIVDPGNKHGGGLRWLYPYDELERSFGWIGKLAGGTFRVTARPLDGHRAPVTLDFADGENVSASCPWLVKWSKPGNPTQMQIDLVRISSTHADYEMFIYWLAGFLGEAIKPPQGRATRIFAF